MHQILHEDQEWVTHLLLEGLIDFHGVQMGVPGVLAISMFLAPMLEVVPMIRRDRDVGKLPLLPYSSMVGSGLLWGTYGLVQGYPAVATTNFTSVVLGAYYCWVFCTFCPAEADWLPWRRRTHFVFMGLMVLWSVANFTFLRRFAEVSLSISGNLLCVILFGSPLAAVHTVCTERSTRSLPFLSAVLTTTSSGVWVAYAWFRLRDVSLVLPNAIGLALGLLQLSLFWRFGMPPPPSDVAGKQVDDDEDDEELHNLIGAHTSSDEEDPERQQQQENDEEVELNHSGVSPEVIGATFS